MAGLCDGLLLAAEFRPAGRAVHRFIVGAVGGAGRCYFVFLDGGRGGMALGGDHGLFHQNFVADRAMLALGLARLRAGRLDCRVGHFCVARGGDLLHILRIASAARCGLFALLRAGRRGGHFVVAEIVAQSVTFSRIADPARLRRGAGRFFPVMAVRGANRNRHGFAYGTAFIALCVVLCGFRTGCSAGQLVRRLRAKAVARGAAGIRHCVRRVAADALRRLGAVFRAGRVVVRHVLAIGVAQGVDSRPRRQDRAAASAMLAFGQAGGSARCGNRRVSHRCVADILRCDLKIPIPCQRIIPRHRNRFFTIFLITGHDRVGAAAAELRLGGDGMAGFRPVTV